MTHSPAHELYPAIQTDDRTDLSVFVEPLDGDMKKVRVSDPSAEFGPPAMRADAFCWGRPVQTDFLPTLVRADRSYPSGVPDLVTARQGIAVSERFKELVERFDPGIHQFHPVTLRLARGAGDVPFFWFAVCARHDSLKLDQLVPPVHENGRWYAESEPRVSNDQRRIVYAAARFGPGHLWIEARRPGQIVVSAAFADAIREAGLLGMTLREMPTV